jgi:hypothetical protein
MFENDTRKENSEIPGVTDHVDEKESEAILVEFTTGEGLRPVGLFSRKKEPELAEKSNKAIEKAMSTIQRMANRVNSTVGNIDKRPSNVEVEFGIKFDAEVGVIVAKAKMEAGMTVKLGWNFQ